MSQVIIVSGSPTASSRLTGITRFAEQRLTKAGLFGGHIEVAALPAEDLIRAKFDSPAIIEAASRVAEADAVIIASPVYKASFTGVLKTFLDLLPQKGLADTIVTPLFIGGTIAHLLAIDYSLKPVLGALGAVRFTNGVYAVDTQVVRKDDGAGNLHYELDDELASRLDAALDDLIRQLEVPVHA